MGTVSIFPKLMHDTKLQSTPTFEKYYRACCAYFNTRCFFSTQLSLSTDLVTV